MKLAKIFHTLGLVSVGVFIVSLFALIILGFAFGSQPSTLKWVVIIAGGIVTGVSFVTMLGSFIAESLLPLIRNNQRAALRRNGQPATATVLDFYGVKGGTYQLWREIKGVRIKLKVHLPDGGSFETVVEDTFEVGLQLRQGQTFPAKYDPRTKDVALVMPAKAAEEKKDF